MLCTISVNATLYSGKLTNACTIFFKPWALRREGAKADRKTRKTPMDKLEKYSKTKQKRWASLLELFKLSRNVCNIGWGKSQSFAANLQACCWFFAEMCRTARCSFERLYRSQMLQVNTRWKARAEIYTMHSFAPFSNLNFFVKNRQNFFAIELMNIH